MFGRSEGGCRCPPRNWASATLARGAHHCRRRRRGFCTRSPTFSEGNAITVALYFLRCFTAARFGGSMRRRFVVVVEFELYTVNPDAPHLLGASALSSKMKSTTIICYCNYYFYYYERHEQYTETTQEMYSRSSVLHQLSCFLLSRKISRTCATGHAPSSRCSPSAARNTRRHERVRVADDPAKRTFPPPPNGSHHPAVHRTHGDRQHQDTRQRWGRRETGCAFARLLFFYIQ